MERAMLKEGDAAPAFSARPIFGYPVEVPAGLKAGPIVLFFVPFLGSPFARRTLALLQERFADFDRRGIRIVAITQTELTAARDFVPRYHLLYPLITDPEGELQSLFDIQEDRYLLSSVRSLLSGGSGATGGTGGLMEFGVGWFNGPVRQLGAEFVLDRSGTVRMAHYASGVADVPDLDALLQCASSC
ncbi:MAG: peroxiredoxin [Myxococcota bacterium]|jgi:peroxiredoxin